MPQINRQKWSRNNHFEHYSNYDYPHFGICSQIDVTRLVSHTRQKGFSLTLSMAYLLSYTANRRTEFRHRIRGHEVFEHDVVHPSLTVMGDNELFSFCTLDYCADFLEFSTGGSDRMNFVRKNPSLSDQTERDDLLYMTEIPWITFTSFMHPIHLHPIDSIPRFAWGKIYPEGNILKMPLNIQVHHGLMDGLHVARFFALLQEHLDQAEERLS